MVERYEKLPEDKKQKLVEYRKKIIIVIRNYYFKKLI